MRASVTTDATRVTQTRSARGLTPPIHALAFVPLALLALSLGCESAPTINRISTDRTRVDRSLRPREGRCDEPENWARERVPDLASFEAAPDEAHQVLIHVQAPEATGLEACDVTDSEHLRCVAPRPRLEARYRQHQSEIDCLLADRGSLLGPNFGRPWWYEQLRVSRSREPFPIVLSFSVDVLGRDVRELAAHPVVASLTRPPAVNTGRECSEVREDVTGKLIDGASGDGPFFSIITLRVPVELPDCEACPERVVAERALRVVMERRATCVQRFVAEQSGTHRVLLRPATGLRPHDDAAKRSVSLEFAVPLTRPQARVVASHLYVDRVQTTDLGIPEEPPRRSTPSRSLRGCPAYRQRVGQHVRSVYICP